MLLILSTKT